MTNLSAVARTTNYLTSVAAKNKASTRMAVEDFFGQAKKQVKKHYDQEQQE